VVIRHLLFCISGNATHSSIAAPENTSFDVDDRAINILIQNLSLSAGHETTDISYFLHGFLSCGRLNDDKSEKIYDQW